MVQFCFLQGLKHSSRERTAKVSTPLTSFFGAFTSSSLQKTEIQQRTPLQQTLNTCVKKEESVRSELIFLLGSIKSNISARSSDALLSLFPSMFPDSNIASQVSLGRTKCHYLLCFGIAPYLEEILIRQVRDSEEYVAMFDESLNSVSQRCQMDVIVRFWNQDKKEIVSKYFSSSFLERTNADSLLEAFSSMLGSVGMRSMIAVSMDGPSVNWSFMTKLGSKRQQADLPTLLNVGSCGLHILHGAFQLGHRQSEWNLNEIFSAGYYLFKDSPKRRSEFQEFTSSDDFPLKFCRIRWCENLQVAKRFLDLIPHLEKYCLQVKPKPTVISFTRIEKALADPLLKAKLGFFISVCATLEPFLRRFQTAKPMIPFLYDALVNIQKNIARR